MRIDLGRRNCQRVQAVSQEELVIEVFPGLSVDPDSLRKPRPEELVRHAPLRLDKKRECSGQGPASGRAPVTGIDRDCAIEPPRNIATDNERRRGIGGPENQIVVQPLIENVTDELQQVAIQAEVIAY